MPMRNIRLFRKAKYYAKLHDHITGYAAIEAALLLEVLETIDDEDEDISLHLFIAELLKRYNSVVMLKEPEGLVKK